MNMFREVESTHQTSYHAQVLRDRTCGALSGFFFHGARHHEKGSLGAFKQLCCYVARIVDMANGG